MVGPGGDTGARVGGTGGWVCATGGDWEGGKERKKKKKAKMGEKEANERWRKEGKKKKEGREEK